MMHIPYSDRFTPEQRKAWQDECNAEVKALCSRLTDAIQNIGSDGHYKAYLDSMARFHDYSYRNTFLIASQDPDAQLVASYNTWKSLGRQVRKGEKGIRILAPIIDRKRKLGPVLDEKTGLYLRNADGSVHKQEEEKSVLGFKPVSIFDIRQTDGDPLPLPTKTLMGEVQDYEKVFDALVGAAEVEVKHSQLEPGTYGMCDTRTGQILLTEGMSEAQELKTLIHEIAHCHLHSPQMPDLGRELKEVQAESVAYVVAAHYGIDTSDYTLGYLASWTNDAPETAVRQSLEIISRFSGALIARTDRALGIEKLSELALAKEQEKNRRARQAER